MAIELIINASLPETRIALMENNEIQELHIERDSDRGIVGNIYKGKVLRVLPGMQAAFVDIGLEKAAFLYVDDIHFPDMQNSLATNALPDPAEIEERVKHFMNRASRGSGGGSSSPSVDDGFANQHDSVPGVTGNEDVEPGNSQPRNVIDPRGDAQPRSIIDRPAPVTISARPGGRHSRNDRNRGGRDRNAGRHGGGRHGQGQQGQGLGNQGQGRMQGGGRHGPQQGGGRHAGGRGRGGRMGPPQPVQSQGFVPPSARTPEDHAALQREYGRIMMQMGVEDDDESQYPRPNPQQPQQQNPQQPSQQAQHSDADEDSAGNQAPQDQEKRDQQTQQNPQTQEEEVESYSAAPEPSPVSVRDSKTPAQPVARAPSEDPEEAEGGESAAIYRPEPEIDEDAWAEDVSRAKNDVVKEALEDERTTSAPTLEDMGVQIESERITSIPTGGEQEESESVSSAPQAPSDVRPAPVVGPSPRAPGSAGGVGPQPRRNEGRGGKDRQRNSKSNRRSRSGGGSNPSSEEDDEIGEMPRRRSHGEGVNISDLVKEGQEILVQVVKDPIGTKGARLTCHVSLPGRYLVFMPTVDHIGVSRRIESEMERRRLKELISRVRPPQTGVIVRTASGNQSDQKLKADLDYLVQSWNDIQGKFQKQKTSTMVYQDLNIILRSIRDMCTDEVDRVVVDSPREHKGILKFVMRFMPHIQEKLELYEGRAPIFDSFGIESELSRALDRKVWLKSGGYIVIDQAEALVAIDVNTGRYVGKSTLEETILKTNLEAVEEIAYQLRLRNCGGIIIIDFIDMERENNREKVYALLEEALKKDRARPTILKISSLGLVEMTRKRTRDSMVRSLCEPCRYCDGKGYLKNKYTVVYDILRDIQREAPDDDTSALSIQCHPSVVDVLLEEKRDVLENLEHQYNKRVSIQANGAYHVEQYELMAHRSSKNVTYSSEERRQIIRQRSQELLKQRRVSSQSAEGASGEARPDAGEGRPPARGPGRNTRGGAGRNDRGGRHRRGRGGSGGGNPRMPNRQGGPQLAPGGTAQPLPEQTLAEGQELQPGNTAPDGGAPRLEGGGDPARGPRDPRRRRFNRRGGRNRNRPRTGPGGEGSKAPVGEGTSAAPALAAPAARGDGGGGGGGGDES